MTQKLAIITKNIQQLTKTAYASTKEYLTGISFSSIFYQFQSDVA